MMSVWRSLEGMLYVEIITPNPAATLCQIADKGIRVSDISHNGDVKIRLMIRQTDKKKFAMLAASKGYAFKVIRRIGLFWSAAALCRRPILIAAILFALIGMFFVPGRIMFVYVEGNSSVPTNRILEAAEMHGICFGATRRDVRSEKVKNALLEAIPELQWVGVNTSGCIAVISVKERNIPETENTLSRVGSVIATRDGVITSLTVHRGNKLCRVGQSVTAGQVLISGYTDYGHSLNATCADGEIYAATKRALTVIAPSNIQFRGDVEVSGKRISLIIGKNRINFYKGSGISDPECVRMYKESYVTLPGGFQLPVRIAVEQWYSHEISDSELSYKDLTQQAIAFASAYLGKDMVAGKILHAAENLSTTEGALILSGDYDCIEMIGQLRSEEIIKPNGNDN